MFILSCVSFRLFVHSKLNTASPFVSFFAPTHSIHSKDIPISCYSMLIVYNYRFTRIGLLNIIHIISQHIFKLQPFKSGFSGKAPPIYLYTVYPNVYLFLLFDKVFIARFTYLFIYFWFSQRLTFSRPLLDRWLNQR